MPPAHPESFDASRAPTASAFLLAKHAAIQRAWGNSHCGVIADQLAARLLADGVEDVSQMSVYEEVPQPDRHTKIKTILPHRYRGKMQPWYAHTVCCAEGFAFDPIIGVPVPVSEYTQRLCGEKIQMTVRETADALRQRLE